MSQKSADLRLTNVSPREVNVPLRKKMDHENEPLFISHMILQNLGIDSKEMMKTHLRMRLKNVLTNLNLWINSVMGEEPDGN